MKDKAISIIAIIATLIVFVGVAKIDGTETAALVELLPWFGFALVGAIIWVILGILFG